MRSLSCLDVSINNAVAGVSLLVTLRRKQFNLINTPHNYRVRKQRKLKCLTNAVIIYHFVAQTLSEHL